MVSLLKSVAQLDAFILSANHSGAGGEGGDVGLSAEPPDLLVGHWTLEMDIGPRVCKIQTDVNAFPRASMLCPEKH